MNYNCEYCHTDFTVTSDTIINFAVCSNCGRGKLTEIEKKSGRPITIDKTTKLKILRLYAEKMPQERIAQELGVSLSTVRRELKADKIEKRLEEARNFQLRTQPVMKMDCGFQQCWGDGADETPKINTMVWCAKCGKMELIRKVF